MTKRLKTVAVVLPMILASAPGTAGAASSPVVADCAAHGRLTRHYSITDLRTALTELPTDIQEYTNCYALIQRQLLAGVSSSRPDVGSTSQGSSGGSFLPLPVVVVLIVLGVGAAGFGALALRRR